MRSSRPAGGAKGNKRPPLCASGQRVAIITREYMYPAYKCGNKGEKRIILLVKIIVIMVYSICKDGVYKLKFVHTST